MDFYRRNLPHWQPNGAEYFVTFRLAGSLPRTVIEKLKEQRDRFISKNKSSDSYLKDKVAFEAHLFKTYDQLLDKAATGPVWLKNEHIAKIAIESIHFYDQKLYDLYAFVIMSNHVHMVFRHLKENHEIDFPVTDIMKSIKSYTGKESNKLLDRSGQFWQCESYDRVIRDDLELENVILYTLSNPVKANLITNWKDWPFSYCKPEFRESV